jgi:sRNA-binding protein
MSDIYSVHILYKCSMNVNIIDIALCMKIGAQNDDLENISSSFWISLTQLQSSLQYYCTGHTYDFFYTFVV